MRASKRQAEIDKLDSSPLSLHDEKKKQKPTLEALTKGPTLWKYLGSPLSRREKSKNKEPNEERRHADSVGEVYHLGASAEERRRFEAHLLGAFSLRSLLVGR